MGYLMLDHAQILILAETAFNFPALAYTVYRSLFKTLGYPIADHAQILILHEMVFNFHALAYTGACLNL